jgi:hypothetical protein
MMPTTTLTVKLINPPGSTGRGSIVGTDDQRLGIFPEKVALFEVGKTYEVEYVETDRNGKTLRNVKSAKPIAAASPQQGQQTAAASQPSGSGNGYYRPTSPEDSERMFVCATLTALIRAGEVKNDKAQLFHTTNMLRLLYQHTFANGSTGAGGTFTAGDANRPRLVAAE